MGRAAVARRCQVPHPLSRAVPSRDRDLVFPLPCPLLSRPGSQAGQWCSQTSWLDLRAPHPAFPALHTGGSACSSLSPLEGLGESCSCGSADLRVPQCWTPSADEAQISLSNKLVGHLGLEGPHSRCWKASGRIPCQWLLTYGHPRPRPSEAFCTSSHAQPSSGLSEKEGGREGGKEERRKGKNGKMDGWMEDG